MKLVDCLDELRVNFLRDNGLTQYWSDPTLVRYIDIAVRRFARRALCIRDDVTEAVTQVPLVAGQAVYTLHESVLRVVSARHEDSAQDMMRITHPINFARMNPYTDPVNFHLRTDLDYNTNPVVNANSQPQEYATDEGTQIDDKHQIRLLVRPTPDANQTGKIIYLRTIRLPLQHLSANRPNDIPEIPEDWHLDALSWAAYLALRNWDGDAGEKQGLIEEWNRADEHKKRFEDAVKECLKETADKLDQRPTWFFGQGGFSYVHN